MNLEKVIKAFEKNNYIVNIFGTKEEATDYIVSSIKGYTVGFGDSATLEVMGLADKLSKDNTVFDPSAYSGDEFLEMGKKALDTEIFFTSVNGAAETGELVNIDSTGNRVAGSLYGHRKVYFVFGINKIEPTLEKAIWRAQNIAAPINAKRFGFKTPCAVKGDRCYDCNSADRICNAMVVHLKRMKNTIGEIIIIEEELGM